MDLSRASERPAPATPRLVVSPRDASLVLCLALGGCGFQSAIAQDSGVPPVVDGAGNDAAPDGSIDCFAQWRAGTLQLSTPQKAREPHRRRRRSRSVDLHRSAHAVLHQQPQRHQRDAAADFFRASHLPGYYICLSPSRPLVGNHHPFLVSCACLRQTMSTPIHAHRQESMQILLPLTRAVFESY